MLVYVNLYLTCVYCMQCLLQINMCQILEPQCAFAKPKTLEWDFRVQEAEIMSGLETPLPPLNCRVNVHLKHQICFISISLNTLIFFDRSYRGIHMYLVICG